MRLPKIVPDPRLNFAILAGAVMAVIYMARYWHRILPIANFEDRQDYVAFFVAARSAAFGLTDNLYDPAVFHGLFPSFEGSGVYWLYPPTMLLLLVPFGFLPFAVAKGLWASIAAGEAFLIGRTISGSSARAIALILSPATFAALFIGQVSPFFTFLLFFGLKLALERPALSGLCFALLTVKPQYGLLVVPFLFAIRAWRAMAVAAGLSVILVLTTLVFFGPDVWRDFLDSLGGGMVQAYGQSGQGTGRVTLTNALGVAGLGDVPAGPLYAALIAAAILFVFRSAGNASHSSLVAFVLAATGLVSPYLFVYDYLVFAAAILLVACLARTLAAPLAYVFGALWFAPLAPLVFESHFTPAFLWVLNLLAVALIAVWIKVVEGGQRGK